MESWERLNAKCLNMVEISVFLSNGKYGVMLYLILWSSSLIFRTRIYNTKVDVLLEPLSTHTNTHTHTRTHTHMHTHTHTHTHNDTPLHTPLTPMAPLCTYPGAHTHYEPWWAVCCCILMMWWLSRVLMRGPSIVRFICGVHVASCPIWCNALYTGKSSDITITCKVWILQGYQHKGGQHIKLFKASLATILYNYFHVYLSLYFTIVIVIIVSKINYSFNKI